jgi:hypothetical protein
MNWTHCETNTHQDGVIAHVIGATILGHFILDETAFMLLDIGFVWNIYLDAEMGLLPHPVAIGDLEVSADDKSGIQRDVERLLAGDTSGDLEFVQRSTLRTPITEVNLFQTADGRRLMIECESGQVIIETSIAKGEITVND